MNRSIKSSVGSKRGNGGNRARGMFRAAAAAALAVGALGLAGCGGDDDDARDSALVGDWAPVEASYSDDDLYFMTFKSSGQICMSEYMRVDNVWIGGEDCGPTWSTGGGYININYFGEQQRVQYAISGNTLTVTFCYGGECDTEVMTRSSGKPAGAVSNDANLYTLSGYGDLMWVLSSDPNEYLDFDAIYFHDGEYYFDYSSYDRIWYSSGNRIHLLGLNSSGAVTNRVELEYRITGSGSGRRLYIREVFDGTPATIEDEWHPAECCGGDYAPPLPKRPAASSPVSFFRKAQSVESR